VNKMNKWKIMLILLLFQGSVFAQINILGEERVYELAIKVFETKYEKKHYDRFKGKIDVIDSNNFIFRDKFRRISNIRIRDDRTGTETKNELKKIFTEGILYPEIIMGTGNYKDKKTRKKWYNANIRILFIEELKKINPDFQTKRFLFWRRVGGHHQRCYIELYNSYANENTTIEEFINDAILTFYYKAPFK